MLKKLTHFPRVAVMLTELGSAGSGSGVVARSVAGSVAVAVIIVTLTITITITGCDLSGQERQKADPLATYECTTEQMVKAQNEYDWCTKNTSYFYSHNDCSDYCYRKAIIENCTIRPIK